MKIIKKAIAYIFIILIFILLIICYNGYKMYEEAIKKTPINEKIKEIKKNKNYTNINEISNNLKDAIIAVEDHRFYDHKGIDLISTTKAVFTNLSNKDIITGGSSITQQLAKNMYFTQEKKFSRKVAEIFVVSYLEENLKKSEILELYLNNIYYGNGYYGIGEASIGYFKKKPNELTMKEATILAGLPNAPSAYSLNEHEDLALERQKQVLNAMLKYDYIDKKEYDTILKED
ncbi:MAG: transglycosylase domain-containing protein [Bacilli bacterium]|nr:transglycosylase domain-containing protein [Bacilli bacterium]